MTKITHEFCYYIPGDGSSMTEHGVIPACVEAHKPGYRLMSGNGPHAEPWYWGRTLEDAQAVCKMANERMGISGEEAILIVASSMAKSNIRPRSKSQALAG